MKDKGNISVTDAIVHCWVLDEVFASPASIEGKPSASIDSNASSEGKAGTDRNASDHAAELPPNYRFETPAISSSSYSSYVTDGYSPTLEEDLLRIEEEENAAEESWIDDVFNAVSVGGKSSTVLLQQCWATSNSG